MIQRLRNRQGGFTLIELLIVVAIIGIIAAILIPNLIDALQKAKQKRTVSDMRNTGTAWSSWLTDQISAGAAGANVYNWPADTITYEALFNYLHPTNTFFYMQEVPQFDGWKHLMEFGFDISNMLGSNVMAIRSQSQDPAFNSTSYNAGPFVATDYVQDIVWSDGYFVRWPGGVK